MHISTKVEKCLAEVILEIYKNLLENPAYIPPSTRKIKAEVTKRLNEKYPGEKLKIGLGTVQARLQKLLGPEIHDQHYTATISNAVEKFLETQAFIIKNGGKDPQYVAPKIEQIIATCKIVTKEAVSPPTVHDRFLKLLGRNLYSKLYPKIIVPVSPQVEKFFEEKAKRIIESGDNCQSLEEIADECYFTTNFSVGFKIMTDRLRTHLGTERYFQKFTKKSSTIDKEEQVMIGEWWVTQAELMLGGHTNEVETISAYGEQIQRDYATIRKYGEPALKNKYGDSRWQQIYLDLTTIQRETSAIGFVNHQLLERIFQRGFAATNQDGNEPRPEMFREVNLTPGTRCDLVIADVYRGRFLEQCLKQEREIRLGPGNLLGMPLEAARLYVDEIIDFSTRHGQEVLKEKAKYCDGKIFVCVACTGEFSPDVTFLRHPDYPDLVEMSALDLGRLIGLSGEDLAQVKEILELTRARDWEGLRDRLLADRASNPGEIDWETKRYRDYLKRRDPRERQDAEATALRCRQMEKGQHVLDSFYAKEPKDGNTENDKRDGHQDDAKQEFPLTGKVGDDWIRDLQKEPPDAPKREVNPFFVNARERVSFRRDAIKEMATKLQTEREPSDNKIEREDAQEPAEHRKGKSYERDGDHFHAFRAMHRDFLSYSHFSEPINKDINEFGLKIHDPREVRNVNSPISVFAGGLENLN